MTMNLTQTTRLSKSKEMADDIHLFQDLLDIRLHFLHTRPALNGFCEFALAVIDEVMGNGIGVIRNLHLLNLVFGYDVVVASVSSDINQPFVGIAAGVGDIDEIHSF